MSQRDILLFSLQTVPNFPAKELSDGGWCFHTATSNEEARSLIHRNNYHIGIALAMNPHESTLEAIEEVIIANRNMEWLALLPSDSLCSAAMCKFIMDNFYDYHTLPVDPARLMVTLGHAYGKARLKSRLQAENSNLGEYEMVGSSPVMQELYRNLRKMHDVDSPVLITGESGTGKELAALAIHRHSARSQAPFVAVNCGALPAHLIQSELFGHEKGAFTGAFRRKIGQIESASGGTIFLDEIGDLSLELQVNLLRFLQEKTIQRIGSTQNIPVDVRVIAATNVDIENAVKQGRFREDLYYRLNVLRLKVPPLRDRGSDLELLAGTFMNVVAHECSHEVRGFSKQAVRALYNYNWPGNVRELINRVRQAAIMTESRLITPADLGLDAAPAVARHVMSLDNARQRAEIEAIQSSLQRNQNNVSKTARQLGISRVTLYRLMNKFQIAPYSERSSGRP